MTSPAPNRTEFKKTSGRGRFLIFVSNHCSLPPLLEMVTVEH